MNAKGHDLHDLLECVVNVSEGRDQAALQRLAVEAGPSLLDVHVDADHHRAVFTLAGAAPLVQTAARQLARAVVAGLDIGHHAGVHPRIGALDVVPFVSLEGWPVADGALARAISARDNFARWAGTELGLPCFLYGPQRSLPDVRRHAWADLAPDTGPSHPHLTAGAAAVGARPVLVAYNLWLASDDLAGARAVVTAIRGPRLRALAFPVGGTVQVSCNLIDPWSLGPEAAFDAVASRVGVERAELVGLLPRAVLERAPRHRWPELGLDPSTTIETRLEQAGLDGGSSGEQDD
jgi:glutamate formiminotransferase/glutamate formiminotransferase/formiminotetrahydrofolate cyclodeaminase